MKEKCLLNLLIFSILACKLRGSVIQECLICWENLCTQSNSYGECGTDTKCTDGINIGQVAAETSLCCGRADGYVSSAVTSNGTLSPVTSPNAAQQCTSDVYNEFTGGDFDTINLSGNGEQFFLYDTAQFDCNGCISNVSIYTSTEIQSGTRTTLLQIWSKNTIGNQTVLVLKDSHVLSFSSEHSMEIGSNTVRNSREVNGSLCFEAGNIFGIRLSADFDTILTPKSPGNTAQTYSREDPPCDSLDDVYALNDNDIGNHPMIAVGVTQPPPAESTSTVSPTLSSLVTSTGLSTSTAGVSLIQSVTTSPQSIAIETMAVSSPTSSTAIVLPPSATTSELVTSTQTTASSTPTDPISIIPIVAGAAGGVLLVVVLLIVSVVCICVCVCVSMSRKYDMKDVNGIEMFGHTGRNSVDDMLDFQTRAVNPHHGNGGIDISASQSHISTPCYPSPIHSAYPQSTLQQSNYYDNPTVLDMSKLTSSREFLEDRHEADYTTMNSDVGPRRTPTSINGSRSTVSDNSMKKQQGFPAVHYDVPHSNRYDVPHSNRYDVPQSNRPAVGSSNDYDDPSALGKQYGTLDPYGQSMSMSEMEGSQRVNNRTYFVLENDTAQRIKNNPHQLPIYHVLETGHHVPSAQERDTTEISYETGRLNQQPFFEEQPHYWEPAEEAESIYDQLSQKKCRELKREDIVLNEELGGGQFGTVWKGVWSLRGGGKKNVAVKVCRENVKKEEKARLLREGARMMQFFHPHVVQLYGIVTISEPIYLVIELMKEGDLKDYLKASKPDVAIKPPLAPQQLVKFCKDVATGMRHLAKKNFVHRDLAARNIMLTENLVCKIGDFGMTRSSSHVFDLSKPEQVPLRWTAPEALKERHYSEKSDVYSYGMLMFEIWSLGRNPFPFQEDNQLIINFISQGRIMAPPPGCPREIYRLMAHSWHPNPNERPTFESCWEFLSTDDDSLLQWNSDDTRDLPSEATELGADIPKGYQLFIDLQHQYRIEDY